MNITAVSPTLKQEGEADGQSTSFCVSRKMFANREGAESCQK